MKVWDVIISGAGIIGVSLALELRERGADVLVLDSGEPGQEASSAAAGMLSAVDPETPAHLQPLTRASADLYPAFVEKAERLSGIKTDFRTGAIALFVTPSMPRHHRPLAAAELKSLEPALRAGGCSAYFVANENSVDPALLMQATLQAARARGAEIRGHTAVCAMDSARDEVRVKTNGDNFVARAGVNCQGAWAGAPVRPRKGQMLYLQPQEPDLLRYVVRAPEAYLVPRSSGKILVGATVEDIGYDKTVVPEAVQQLHANAARFVPVLASAAVVSSWAGLRPGTPDDLPILGKTKSGVFVATGHFRNGILLAPITAQIMADMITGKRVTVDISAFAPDRFGLATN